MVAKFIVRTGKGAFSSLLVDRHQAHRFVVTIGWDYFRIITGKVVVVVRLLINFRTVGDARQIVDRPIFLDERRIGATAISLGPAIIVQPNRPWINGGRDHLGFEIKLNVVDAHPVPTCIRIITGASETDDVIGSRTDFRIHTFQRELGCLEIDIQLRRTNKNLGLHQHSVEVHFNPKTWVRWPRIQIISVESD